MLLNGVNYAFRTFNSVIRRSNKRMIASMRQIDTVFALSSGGMAVKTGVAVIRISGPESDYCLKRLLKKPNSNFKNDMNDVLDVNIPKPRYASLRKLYCPTSSEALDSALILYMPGPKSFTGEDVVELHIHGSRAVISGVFQSLEDMNHDDYIKERGSRIRPAERGEFTRRAFDNGCMDLTEVEGLADLLEAETSLQRTQALRQMEGHMREQFEAWRDELMRSLAHTEAVIDFGDDDREDDINEGAMWELIPRIEKLRDDIKRHIADGRKGEIVREGVHVALIGPPNAGKSSLINALARRPAAIVSPIAGTTRDVVEVRLDLGGVPCILSDTAGLRKHSDDPIEQEGMRRTLQAMERSNLKVFVSDCSDPQSMKLTHDMILNHDDNDDYNNSDNDYDSNSNGSNIAFVVRNKMDISDNSDEMQSYDTDMAKRMPNVKTFEVSCLTGNGLEHFENSLSTVLGELVSSHDGQETALVTRERHRSHMIKCLEHLDDFLDQELPMDAAAEELRLAMMELGKVTGRVDVEELLDIIFRDFCIGK